MSKSQTYHIPPVSSYPSEISHIFMEIADPYTSDVISGILTIRCIDEAHLQSIQAVKLRYNSEIMCEFAFPSNEWRTLTRVEDYCSNFESCDDGKGSKCRSHSTYSNDIKDMTNSYDNAISQGKTVKLSQSYSEFMDLRAYMSKGSSVMLIPFEFPLSQKLTTLLAFGASNNLGRDCLSRVFRNDLSVEAMFVKNIDACSKKGNNLKSFFSNIWRPSRSSINFDLNDMLMNSFRAQRDTSPLTRTYIQASSLHGLIMGSPSNRQNFNSTQIPKSMRPSVTSSKVYMLSQIDFGLLREATYNRMLFSAPSYQKSSIAPGHTLALKSKFSIRIPQARSSTSYVNLLEILLQSPPSRSNPVMNNITLDELATLQRVLKDFKPEQEIIWMYYKLSGVITYVNIEDPEDVCTEYIDIPVSLSHMLQKQLLCNDDLTPLNSYTECFTGNFPSTYSTSDYDMHTLVAT